MLVNGAPSGQISVQDRGLQYGDGVFRTLRVLGGQVLHWPRHYRKLQQDCAALSIPCPEAALLLDELQVLIKHLPDGVAKIIITRGTQKKRGYAPAAVITSINSRAFVSCWNLNFCSLEISFLSGRFKRYLAPSLLTIVVVDCHPESCSLSKE